MKIVNGVSYIHMRHLGTIDISMRNHVKEGLIKIDDEYGGSPPFRLKECVVSFTHRLVSVIECPDFETVFEPSAGDRYVYDFKKKQVFKRKASLTNPLIFHRRYLFLDEKRNKVRPMIDYQKDIERVKKWSALHPNPRKMGRRVWWDNFCKENNL